jgi:hypothetical protein
VAIRSTVLEMAIRMLADPGEMASKGRRITALVVLYSGGSLICQMIVEAIVHAVCPL